MKRFVAIKDTILAPVSSHLLDGMKTEDENIQRRKHLL